MITLVEPEEYAGVSSVIVEPDTFVIMSWGKIMGVGGDEVGVTDMPAVTVPPDTPLKVTVVSSWLATVAVAVMTGQDTPGEKMAKLPAPPSPGA